MIGERRKPAPNGVPGYLRIDTVHQGEGPDGKGLYHLNAVDEVAQWEIVAATPLISERYLLPALEAMLRQFPFEIKGFHSGNGSEFLNFHRPSAQPEVEIDNRGRKRRLYKKWLTPLEKLLSLDKPEQYLRKGRTLDALRRAAGALSDTDAAMRLERARDAMFADLERAA